MLVGGYAESDQPWCTTSADRLHRTRAVLSEGEPRDAAANFDNIEFYKLQRIVRFLFHSTAFLYTSVTIQMLKLHTLAWFSRPWCKITATAVWKSRHTTKSHGNREYVIILQG